MAQFRLVMRSGPSVGKVYPLEAQEISIGRDSANAIVVNDAEVSRRHARLESRFTAYVIQDLGSTNGTFVNGKRLNGIQVLNPGDGISLGEGIMFTYEKEIAVDMNATVVSAKASQTVAPAPIPAGAPGRVPPAVPEPVYSRNIPAVPMPAGSTPSVPRPAAAAPAPRRGGRIGIIIVVVAVLLVLLLCVGGLFMVDALRMDCVVPFKYFFNIIGPLVGYGLCP